MSPRLGIFRELELFQYGGRYGARSGVKKTEVGVLPEPGCARSRMLCWGMISKMVANKVDLV